jgi:cyclin C
MPPRPPHPPPRSVAATAVVYFRRVYVTSSYARHDPRVVAPGCLYLASKAEESVVSSKVLLAAMRRLRPGWPAELKQLLDAEMVGGVGAGGEGGGVGGSFAHIDANTPPPPHRLTPLPPLPRPHPPSPQLILEELDTHLVVFSPYLALTRLLASDAQLADLGQNAWAALNDAHRTDLPLVHAPHVLALGCVYLASVICSRDIRAWLQTVDVDLNEVRARFVWGAVEGGGRGARRGGSVVINQGGTARGPPSPASGRAPHSAPAPPPHPPAGLLPGDGPGVHVRAPPHRDPGGRGQPPAGRRAAARVRPAPPPSAQPHAGAPRRPRALPISPGIRPHPMLLRHAAPAPASAQPCMAAAETRCAAPLGRLKGNRNSPQGVFFPPSTRAPRGALARLARGSSKRLLFKGAPRPHKVRSGRGQGRVHGRARLHPNGSRHAGGSAHTRPALPTIARLKGRLKPFSATVARLSPIALPASKNGCSERGVLRGKGAGGGEGERCGW